ncbi:hypothetical protein ORV05_13185 [Amycolatopsis cynarae]|uniref:Uncharacterized protein n=1 Tax=Amycolatopsis cynarae TaxID=2995223 RepID=A0ABY7BC29_9PSEU|nr:hypothetical protein [Amycolatopsis sp. HUAS 11-8]WAL68683.1 hypothetical protein ORV05_13185 [Amycolatopsis sp. HUAS 11-8]
MGDPWAAAGFSRDAVIDGVLAHWQEFRRGVSADEGDRLFRAWLFGEVAAESSDNDHSFALFEIGMGIGLRGLFDDAFLVLGWLAQHYAGHSDPRLAWRVIMGLTDDCVHLAVDSPEHSSAAQRVLREAVDRAGTSASVELERAVCRALVQIALLRGAAGTPWDTRRAHVDEIWAEIAQRWQRTTDPELQSRVAQALVNSALLALQFGDEPAARRAFAETVERLGDTPPGLDEDLDRWVAIARYADRVLDRIAFAEPEFQLGYLRRERYWYPDSRTEDVIVEQARRVHTRSAGTLRSWVCAGQPYVLLLRNFEMTERSGITSAEFMLDEDPADHTTVISYRDAESVLADLDTMVPLIQVASTTAGHLEVDRYAGKFVASNRLYLPGATWFQTVCTLIAAAGQIVVWADELTPALSSELAELVAQGRTDDTVILLEPCMPDPLGQAILPRRAGEPLTSDHPALAPFPNRIDGAGLKGRGVHDCPGLERIVRRLDEIAEQPVGPRQEQVLARLHEQAARAADPTAP